MKKIFLVSVISIFCAGRVLASDYYETTIRDCNPAAMRAALDKASYEQRAVITVVSCNNGAAHYYDSKDDSVVAPKKLPARRVVGRPSCGASIERVVARRHYVEETVQRYEPVVHYIPTDTYTRTRRVCSECDM